MFLKLILLSTFALFSAQKNDVKLNENTTNQNVIQINERTQLRKLQLETPIHAQSIENLRLKFLEGKEIDGVYDLYDVNFNLSYYLIVFKDGGYLIYNIEEKNYEEFSETNKCSYSNCLDKMMVYLSVGNYYYVDDGILVSTSKEYTISTNKELSMIRTSFTKLQDAKQQDLSSQSEFAASINSSSSDLPKEYNLVDDYYFHNLHSNYCDNYLGSCGYIAIQMLLGYFNFIKGQGGIVPNEYIFDGENLTSDNYKECTDSPGSKFDFHQHLLDIGESLGCAQGGIDMNELDKIFKAYMNEHKDYKAETLKREGVGDVFWKTYFALYMTALDVPAIVHITGYDKDISVDHDVSHAAICYGYVDSLNGIRLHIGERSLDMTDVISRSYVVQSFYMANFTSAHKHAYGYIWDTKEECNKYCVCGDTITHQHNLTYEKVDVYQHKVICLDCGKEYLEDHHYVQMNKTVFICNYCGEHVSHLPTQE